MEGNIQVPATNTRQACPVCGGIAIQTDRECRCTRCLFIWCDSCEGKPEPDD